MPQDPNLAALNATLSMNPALATQPATAMALSYSSAKDSDITSMSAMLRGKQIHEALAMLPAEEQMRYWESMSQADRNMARGAGYLLPIEAHEVAHQNSIEKGVAKAFGFIGKFTPNAVEKPLKASLHGYSSIIENTIQRGTRTAMVGTSEEGLFALVRVDEWDRWWGEADKDNAALDYKTEARIRDQFGDSLTDLVHAEIRKPGYLNQAFMDLVAKGDSEQAGQLDEIMRSTEFAQAFKQVQDAQLSMGRLIPHMIGMLPGEWNDLEGTKLFDVISGPLDAAWRLFTDPLNRVTSGNPSQVGPRVLPANPVTGTVGSRNLIRARRQQYVVPKFSESAARAKLDDAFNGTDKMSDNVRRYFNGAGAHLETIRNNPKSPEAAVSLRELKRNYKAIWPLYDNLLKGGVKDSDSAYKYFTDDIGFRQILSGEKAASLKIIPYRTRMGQLWKEHKPGSVVDFLEKGGSIVADSMRASAATLGDNPTSAAAVEQTGKQLDDWRRTWNGRMATAGRRLNTQTVALDDSGMLNIMADDAVEQVNRLARYYGPKFWADQISATFSMADEATRKNIVKGLLATQAEAIGILKPIEGKEWFAKYSKAIDDSMAGTYALGDVGKLANGERSAWLLEDARPYLPVPSFKEFHAQSAKIGMTKSLWGIANTEMVDYFMTTLWRPAMLLRPATAMRNAIDEMANTMVRNGARSFVTQRAELRIANRNQWESRQAAKATALAADENAKALRQAFDATPAPGAAATKAEKKAYRKQEQALAKAEEDAQILYARFEGTKASFDPTAGRLFRMYSNSAKFFAQKTPFLPQQMKDTLTRAVSGESVRDVYMAHVYGKLSDGWLKVFAEDTAKLTYLDDLVDDVAIRSRLEEDMIGSSRDSLAENMNKVDQVVKLPGKKGKYHYASISNPKSLSPVDSYGARAWSQRLNKMADDEVAMLAMLHLDNEAKAIKLMARAVRENPEYVSQLRVLGDKTPEQFAAQALAEVKAHLSDSAGNLNQSLVDAMVQKAGGVRTLNRDAFSPEKLNELPTNMRPDKIIGREGILVQEGRSLYDLVQNAFQFFGEMTAYISRHPQMVDEYLTARVNLAPWEESLKRGFIEKGIKETRAAELARKQAHVHAVDDATLKVLNYVDNPAIRSQAAVIFRNIAPFYRAQEEFFRRWARTMKYSPEMFARANLYLDGADNSGFFITDQDGRKYFTYPGTKVMSEAMAKLGSIFGVPMDILPVPVPMTGEVNMLAPGFQSDMWTKVFNGPIHSVPVAVMENMTNNPYLTALQRKAYGDVAAGQDWYKGLIPSAARPFAESFILGDDERRFAAMKQAAAYLVANDDPDFKAAAAGDLTAKQRVLEKLRRHANGILFTRSILAPNVPASPRAGSGNAPTTPEADPASQAIGMQYIDDRYYQLIEKVGRNEAYGYWMKEHPDEIPFLTGGTEGESKLAYLPMTTRAFEFMDENRDIMTRYKKAAGFLVPQEEGDTDMRAWQLAMDLGIRKYKDIGDYVDDISRATDMAFYYEQKSKYDKALLELKASGQSGTALRESWSAWRDGWLPFHPLVRQEIEEGQIRQDNRKETLDEFAKMLNDPDVPRTPQLEKLRQLVEGYYRLEAAIAPIANRRDDISLDQKETMRARFHAWAKETVLDDPGAKLMYDRIFAYLD